ncbi:MAG: preprotein translocase subunit SecG [Clostridia bacterium]|nr:preprotein translocase subunit SecG [Clostridia bacterium]
MELALMIVLLVISVLMIVVVLVQKTKSAGLGEAYGSDTQSFTTKGKAASREAKLQKITVALAVIMFVLTLLCLILIKF